MHSHALHHPAWVAHYRILIETHLAEIIAQERDDATAVMSVSPGNSKPTEHAGKWTVCHCAMLQSKKQLCFLHCLNKGVDERHSMSVPELELRRGALLTSQIFGQTSEDISLSLFWVRLQAHSASPACPEISSSPRSSMWAGGW